MSAIQKASPYFQTAIQLREIEPEVAYACDYYGTKLMIQLSKSPSIPAL